MGAKILIAEDEPFIVESLSFLLSREGYDVQAVDTGAAALDAMRAVPPDLMLLDIMLPETNGFDVLRQLRAVQALATLPVMVLTAKGQDADRKRMMELGANDFMTKPFSNRDLLTRIAELIEEHASAGADRPVTGS